MNISYKIKSWRECPISTFFQIQDIMKDESLLEYDKEVMLISLLCDCPEEDIWQLNINDLHQLQQQKLWLDEFNINDKVKLDKIKLNNKEYKVIVNLVDMNVAQYIDFQTFWAKRDNLEDNIGNILACFIIPKGKKYADGYDIKEVVDDIYNYLDIMTAEEMLYFFLKQSLDSTILMLAYLNLEMKRLKKKSPSEKTLMLETQLKELTKATLDGFTWLSKCPSSHLKTLTESLI